jgi:hypothetical protein
VPERTDLRYKDSQAHYVWPGWDSARSDYPEVFDAPLAGLLHAKVRNNEYAADPERLIRDVAAMTEGQKDRLAAALGVDRTPPRSTFLWTPSGSGGFNPPSS